MPDDSKTPIKPSNFRLPPLRTMTQGVQGGPDSAGPGVTFGGISPQRMPNPYNAPGPFAPSGVGARFKIPFAEGGKVKKPKTKKMAKGGSTASKRADGCATKGKTKGRFV